jgi:hypothetical protein
MRLIDRGLHLCRSERRTVRVRRLCAAARRDDLDDICAFFDNLTDRSTHTVGTVSLLSEVPKVPASDRDRPTGK